VTTTNQKAVNPSLDDWAKLTKSERIIILSAAKLTQIEWEMLTSNFDEFAPYMQQQLTLAIVKASQIAAIYHAKITPQANRTPFNRAPEKMIGVA
jgi:hypothetical protein